LRSGFFVGFESCTCFFFFFLFSWLPFGRDFLAFGPKSIHFFFPFLLRGFLLFLLVFDGGFLCFPCMFLMIVSVSSLSCRPIVSFFVWRLHPLFFIGILVLNSAISPLRRGGFYSPPRLTTCSPICSLLPLSLLIVHFALFAENILRGRSFPHISLPPFLGFLAPFTSPAVLPILEFHFFPFLFGSILFAFSPSLRGFPFFRCCGPGDVALYHKILSYFLMFLFFSPRKRPLRRLSRGRSANGFCRRLFDSRLFSFRFFFPRRGVLLNLFSWTVLPGRLGLACNFRGAAPFFLVLRSFGGGISFFFRRRFSGIDQGPFFLKLRIAVFFSLTK